MPTILAQLGGESYNEPTTATPFSIKVVAILQNHVRARSSILLSRLLDVIV